MEWANLIIHIVEPGDSIYSIWKKYGVPVETIVSDNALTNPDKLIIGQALVINSHNSKSKMTIDVNGYAFPSIEKSVLEKTLPYLTYLSIFSYQVKPDGSLTSIDDTPLIQAARKVNVAPIMVITNIAEGASFSSDLAHILLTNQYIQNNLIGNVIKTLKEKNYYGLDIDFEYIFPNDRENYNSFLQKIVTRLRPLGYTIVTSLAPKTMAEQRGLLYEAHDYPAHGRMLDHVIIMTYEWGYTFGPAQAVAPINQVKKVLNYATSVIPSQKILMGMPNYGYDWTLPFIKGTAAQSLSNTAAIDLASSVSASIQYDKLAQAPYFNYYDTAKKKHAVWFDDARSIEARLKLVQEYQLGGVSYWTINKFFPQNWLVLESQYNIRKVI